MPKLPAMQFYTSDWLSDPAVRSVSFPARGLWIDLLCIMSENDPRGFLKLNGKPLSVDQIARMTGGRPDEVSRLLTELETAGVFSRQRDVIYSRRIVRDEEIRATRSHCGAMGGRPKSKTKANTKAKAKQNITPSSSSSSSKKPPVSKETSPTGGNLSLPKGMLWHQLGYQEKRRHALEILNELNEKCGKNYGPTDHHELDVIVARLDEGRNREDFTRIIDTKLQDPNFLKNWYRPSTLFKAGKFQIYLDEDPEGFDGSGSTGLPAPEPPRDTERDRRIAERHDDLLSRRDKSHDAWWDECKRALAADMNEHSYTSFITPLVVFERTRTTVKLIAPPDVASWVRDHYIDTIAGETGCEVIILDGSE